MSLKVKWYELGGLFQPKFDVFSMDEAPKWNLVLHRQEIPVHFMF
jgi:hypothetical protein